MGGMRGCSAAAEKYLRYQNQTVGMGRPSMSQMPREVFAAPRGGDLQSIEMALRQTPTANRRSQPFCFESIMRLQRLVQSDLSALRDSIHPFSEHLTIFMIATMDENAEIRGREETFLVIHGFNSLFDFSGAHEAKNSVLSAVGQGRVTLTCLVATHFNSLPLLSSSEPPIEPSVKPHP